LYQKLFDLTKTRSATTDFVTWREQWMPVIAQIMLLTIGIA